MTRLTDQIYWQKVQGSPCMDLDSNNAIKLWLDRNFDFTKINNCVEIGCYPGRYLTIFGDRGVELNGVDYLPRVKEIERLCSRRGYKVGAFYAQDFLSEPIPRKFDCVYSLGFVEHFTNWQEVFSRHFDLVAPKGYLIVEVPNFSGWLQRLPRLLFDRENYRRHNIKAMLLDEWVVLLRANNFEVVKAEGLGGYMLWFEDKQSLIGRLFRGIVVRLLKVVRKLLYGRAENHVAFSGALIVVAQRRS
jgi:SAM-dependent methyltransferase